MTRRRRDYRIWYVLLAVFIMVFLFSFLSHRFNKSEKEVGAASLVNFDPGYIISDWQMGNYHSMSETDIQAFLKSKNTCYDTNISKYTAGEKVGYFSETSPPRTWHVTNGHFVCMADEIFDGGTAAHIIYRAAQDYRINPQVLIVLLEKEQSLITDSFPHSQQYRSATGYGCPDTAPCSSQYYGLQNQIRKAAELFRTVLDGGWTNYPLGDNYVQYNPNSACGGSVVNIRSLATSALYRYTPYQPNAAVLSGESDGCGAYGNMNFYKLFEDWFGGITNTGPTIRRSSMVVEGEYVISSNIDGGKVISIDRKEAELSDTPNIRIENNERSYAQKWTIKNNGDETYTIVNSATGKALDVQGASTDKGANVHLYKSNGTCAQKWQIIKNDDKTFSFYSSCSDLVLDLSGGVAYDGANINVWRVNGSDAQKWKLVPMKTVDDGDYTIVSRLSSNIVIDINGGADGASDGTNIQVFNRNNTKAQEWTVKYNIEDGYYDIINPTTEKSLDVQGAGVTIGANVQLYEANGTCAQKWQIAENGDKTFSIYSACSSLALDVSGGLASSGANINIWRVNGSNAQKWKFDLFDFKSFSSRGDSSKSDGVEEGVYSIASIINNEKVIDIAGGVGVATLGTNIQLWRDNKTAAQQWSFRLNDDGTYTIINNDTGKAIDVNGASLEAGANVQLWRDNGTCAQKWYIEKDENNYYTFKSACSELVIDASGGVAIDGTNINLWRRNGTDAQKWIIKRR